MFPREQAIRRHHVHHHTHLLHCSAFRNSIFADIRHCFREMINYFVTQTYDKSWVTSKFIWINI